MNRKYFLLLLFSPIIKPLSEKKPSAREILRKQLANAPKRDFSKYVTFYQSPTRAMIGENGKK